MTLVVPSHGAWVNFLAGFGAVLLTFLAGTEIDPRIVRKHFWSSMTIGVMGFVAPYLGVLAYAHWGIEWDWPQAHGYQWRTRAASAGFADSSLLRLAEHVSAARTLRMRSG